MTTARSSEFYIYVAIIVRNGSVEPREVIKQFSNAFGAVHFGIEVTSCFFRRDKCHAAQKYDSSQSVRSVLPAPPPIFYPRAVLELTVKKAFVKVDFFQTSKKKMELQCEARNFCMFA